MRLVYSANIFAKKKSIKVAVINEVSYAIIRVRIDNYQHTGT